MVDTQRIVLGEGSCEDLVQCILNLGDLDIKILRRVMKKGPLKNDDLSKHFKRDKSIVHRCLQRLMTCGLVIREKVNISIGGYYYLYSTIPEEQIKSQVNDCVESMYNNMRKLMDDFKLSDRDGKKKKR